MWKCRKCKSENYENNICCAVCGEKRAQEPKKNTMIYGIFGVVMVLAVAVGILLFCTMTAGAPTSARYSSSDERKYSEAQKLLTEGKLEEAVSAFSEIENYMDSPKYIMYLRAILLAEGGQYDAAARSFASLGEFRDSSLMVTYYNARGLEVAQRYEEAQEVYQDIITFRDSSDRLASIPDLILERDYNKAAALRDAGQYEEAVVLFGALDGYKDSAEQEEACKQAVAEIEAQWQTVGSTVCFGRYEQDNNTDNGPEAIEWQVLDVQEGRALLISKYALDFKQYHCQDTRVTWQTCSLRGWLNKYFMNIAFTADERSKIPTVTVIAHKNPSYNTNPGQDTQDQIFLLSITEAKQYFKNDEDMKVSSTAYAKAQGLELYGGNLTVIGESTCWWWLRSPGGSSDRAARVDNYGAISRSGISVADSTKAIRPALWVDFAS